MSSFTNTDDIRGCPSCRESHSVAFEIPELWWAAYCRNSNGYFGCEDTTGEQGNVIGFSNAVCICCEVSLLILDPDKWARFILKHLEEGEVNYGWYKLNITQ